MAELEARKQAKYREIRDTELDHAQNKLSDEEFARQNAELRGDAIGDPQGDRRGGGRSCGGCREIRLELPRRTWRQFSE